MAMWTLDRKLPSFDLARLATVIPLLAAALVSACSAGAADTPDARAGSGGFPQASGTMAQGGSGAAAGTAVTGTAGSGSSGGDTTAVCPALTEFTLAIH